TGKVRYAYPICNVQSGQLNAPVTLNYHGGGIKLREGEGSAGMGWSVSAGGKTTREVRGFPDDVLTVSEFDNRAGWFVSAAAVDAFQPTANETCADFNTIHNSLSTRDTEPDIFHISAPGLNCSFLFDKNKIIRVFPYEDVVITYETDERGQIDKFEVVTNTGVKYIFDELTFTSKLATPHTGSDEPAHFKSEFLNYAKVHLTTNAGGQDQYADGIEFYSSWGLSEISSPGFEKITFEYEPNYSGSRSAEWKTVANAAGTALDTLYSVNTSVYSRMLKAIQGKNLTATLKWSGNMISSVTLTEGTHGDNRTFRFSYVTVRNPSEDVYDGVTLVKEGVSKSFLKSIL
ncbi:MAG TPA: hypothetical protein VEB86_07560, partial [Chryseosolibacter sp.]|nr:hypothetical protein [Chryseosolibacter sp.]